MKTKKMESKPKESQPEPIPLFQIFLDPELLDKLTATKKRRDRKGVLIG